ncbi:hypothetical protein SUGI_1124900 [Cryptomeria japonica]|nr:hypothetical protein SUGI_1124900 [Cryptomeria japonica]
MESNSMASTSGTTSCIPENEASQEITPFASTSGTSGCILENEASQEMPPFASTSGTTSCIPENKVMGPFHDVTPYASTMVRSSKLIQKSSYDVFMNHREPDVKKTLATRIYEILCDMKFTTFLDSKELEYDDLLPTTLKETIRSATLHIAIFSKGYAKSA